MACAEIRDNLRTSLSESRQIRRDKALLNKRNTLQDLEKIRRDVTEAEVILVGNKLKIKSAVQVDDLAVLKIAFVQDSNNIPAFLKIKGALHALVRELSSHKSNYQLVAAECICNLALGDEWTCLQVAKAAGPYLIAMLSGCNYNLTSVSIWALGNLAGSDEKTWKILQAQGFLGKLLKLIEDNQPHDQIQLNSLLALVQLLYVGSNLLTTEEINLIATTLGRVSNTSSKGFQVSQYLLTSLEGAEEELIKAKAIEKCLQYMEGNDLNDETVALFTPAVRSVANLIAEPSGAGCSQVFQHWKSLQDTIQKVFSSPYSHLVEELGWLMANLVNHPQSQSSLQEYAFDIQIFEAQFACLNRR